MSLTLHSLCTHLEAWCSWRNSHTWKHVNIAGHQPPCCLDTASSLLLHSFGQISLPSPQWMFQTIGALLVFTQPPLPYFPLNFQRVVWPPTSQRKVKPHRRATKATSLLNSTTILSFFSSNYRSPCSYLRPIPHLCFQLRLLSALKAVYVIHHFFSLMHIHSTTPQLDFSRWHLNTIKSSLFNY